MRVGFSLLLLLWSAVSMAQNIQSPEDFLGYKLGERFTPHSRIVEYFQLAARSMPGNMKLETYGRTYGGRPLLLAVVSSSKNIDKLEEIRLANLSLAGISNPQKNTGSGPAIVWLSYNVHGNEASSSEVSMKVLYDLLTLKNPATASWLSNTVVIIDPCLNPDGRDRYVNWYNSVAGRYPNPDPSATEHDEPWPTGRGNHYSFDLNRDWAWQSQIESRLRAVRYNQWMPHVHVDFHEQYPGNPYYFAPAAEPLHEVITPWQRSFQTVIGKNHARYFDENGWLYFTREYFDLFYPAYGDTYPIYNGSIGMTYEQAGHGIAGLAIKTGDDTLKLLDRISHHYTTSMSTIEVSSANADKLRAEFAKYFAEGMEKGYGVNKSYVIGGANPKKVKPLLDLFDANGIKWSYVQAKGKLKGFSYVSGKEEVFQPQEKDILVSALQPKSALVRVLFEPESALSDSSTYDITAWALPYAYGLQAWAVKEVLTGRQDMAKESKTPFTWSNSYGYLMEYNSLADGKTLASMLKGGVRVRFAEKAFTYVGKNYAPGTIILLTKGNESKKALLEKMVGENNLSMIPVNSGFMDSGIDFGSDKVRILKKPNVAVITGNHTISTALGEVWHFFDRELEYPVTMMNTTDPASMDLRSVDVIVVPAGSYKFLSDKEASANLKNWVKQGGKLIVLDQAVAQLASGEWGLKAKKEEEKEGDDSSYEDIKRYGDRDRAVISDNIPGAIYKVDLDNTHPLAFGYPDYYFSLKQNAELYEFSKSGWNTGVIRKSRQVSGFVGSRAREKLQDGTVIGVQPMGRGNVIYFADDPLFRSFWENGKLLFVNAVFIAGN